MIIDASTPRDLLFPPGVVCNTVPRDLSVQPMGMFARPAQVKILDIVDRWDWSAIDAWIDEQERRKSRVRDVAERLQWKCLNQNPQGFCWSYSTAHAIMARFMLSGRPIPHLSAHAVACKIKNFQDQGGWAALSHAYACEHGYPTVATWKERSMSRQYDTAATWAEAANYKITQDVVELDSQVWDRTMARKVWWTLLLTNSPVQMDWRFWGHSVLGWGIRRIEKGVYGVDGPNSWGPEWGDNGAYTINLNEHPDPMGCVAVIGTAA